MSERVTSLGFLPAGEYPSATTRTSRVLGDLGCSAAVIRAIVFDCKSVIVATIVLRSPRAGQIEETLADSGMEDAFEVIVAPGDCPTGKPDPAITSWP